MPDNEMTPHEAERQLHQVATVAAHARRATRWYPWLSLAHAVTALTYTVALDVLGAPWWPATGVFAVVLALLWSAVARNHEAAPRHWIRDMGISVATWAILYFVMLDPALQLLGATGASWWVAAGVVAASPFAACAFASARR
ncbi:hypothetical protein GCM10009718_16410 [Isoptericola halotolerans]|uniref:SPW repeat-containing protein n=1 Tax=Isoptericola halotolerans TaxID=300560 RepID=A0ABX2A7E9_9MICO|nr:hypothetical protein [Isoptericola halotolerans]NOV98785.1 hypothetical protein [Isoptericola halotolerans]